MVSLIQLLTNYLTDSKQRVFPNGVPQGSVLAPLLCPENIKARVKCYADDTIFFSVVQDPYISATYLNDDLTTLSQWAHQWKMEFNHDPNKQALRCYSHSKI